MKYFLDTEFIEGFHKPFLGKRRHFIDLISIGIVSENGQSYYAISKDFSVSKASPWVIENVIRHLPEKHVGVWDSPRLREESLCWKSNQEILMDLVDFFEIRHKDGKATAPPNIEIYGYYADYDWVLFCSLFGTMMDLPQGFPMYCRDLKQMMDERGLDSDWKDKYCPPFAYEHHALYDARWNYMLYKTIMNHDRTRFDLSQSPYQNDDTV